MINIVSFRIFINLTFRMLFNIHFQKWSKVTVEENEAYETSSIWNIKFIRRENSQCLSPLFVFYFLSNYDGLRTKLPCLIDNLCDSYSKKLEIIKRGQNYSIYQVSCFINKSLHVASCSTSSSRQGFWHGKLRFKKSHWSKTIKRPLSGSQNYKDAPGVH